VPGNIFGEDNKYHHYIRINAGHPLTVQVRTALQQLATWINQQTGLALSVC